MLDTASSSRLKSLPYLLLLISFSVRIYANAAAATAFASCNNFVSWANIFLCFAFFFEFFFFFCFVTAAAFPWFWRSMSESFPWAAAAASQVHVMLLHSCERALLLLQQSRAFMPLAFWKLDRITIILLDLKVTFRKWVEWVRKTQTNKPLGFSRESDQIWHFHCCFVFSRAINEFQWKRGLHFNEDYHIQTDTQTM